ncbi:uncharacterized protein LOC110907370 [Helianthus annuus]|uniref:uncharacterized protein LOC110907370 n=1 Tax=Helianthus annuus TaxID=4232 RepID=UPI000B8F0D18|nr:uncharacterized protein LOC110907370 [Helianthus annuus]
MASFPWQHLINQVLATQGNNNNNNNNNIGVRVEEDLAKPYKSSNLSCFSQQIADYDFQTKIKMPSDIKTYNGTEDQEDHLQIFTGAARIEKWSNAECCLMFTQTLVGSARIWFNDLPARSVRNFDDLSKGFLANFSQQRRYVKDATVIFQIKHKDDESLREFIERRQRGSEQRISEGRNPSSREKAMNFTLLTKTPQEILATEEVKQSFRPPRPLPKNKRNENSTQFCEFREEKSHHTNDCFQLKKRIEEAVKSGELAHLVKGVRDKMAEGKSKEVNMVDFDGKVPHKRQRLEAWELQCVCFPPTEKDPLSNPLVVEAIVGTLKTSRAYIETGTATEIMFEKFFNRLSNEERSKLQPSGTYIKGIVDIPLKPLGQLTLDVRFSEGKMERVQPLTFVVINIPSNYDVIIGRPGQCAFYMAVSVGHGTVKFPTERGIATLQPTQ